MSFHIALLLVFFSVSAAVFIVMSALSRRSDPVLRRLKQVNNLSGNLQDQFLSMKEAERKGLDPKLAKFLSEMAPYIKPDDSTTKKKLIKAGYRHESGVRIFYGIKAMFAIALFFLYAALGVISNPGPRSVLIALFMAGVGYFIPSLILSMKIKRRQAAINGGLPDALDFMVICVEAGLGLNSTIVRVGKEMGMRSSELSEELLLVNQEMRTGVSREQAFHNLAERNESKHLRVLASSIILSDRLGTNIGDTLRAQSDSLRTQYRQQAEEQAAKAGIKMLFPLVFFILPTLFIIILGPAVILLLKDVLPVINN